MNLEKRVETDNTDNWKFVGMVSLIIGIIFLASLYFFKTELHNEKVNNSVAVISTDTNGLTIIQTKIRDCYEKNNHPIVDFKKVDNINVITVQCNP